MTESDDDRIAAAAAASQGEAVVWFRMGDADLKKYGGPEWVGFDARAAYNWPSTKLESYEAETGIPLFLLLFELPTYGSRATRYALFIARREAGVQERWVDFDPSSLQVKRRAQPEGQAGAANGDGRGKPRGTKAGTRVGARRAGRSAT